MKIRPARKADMAAIRKLAEDFNLDSPVMPADEFTVAEKDHKIAGFVRLVKHPDCFELCSLGVVKEKQKQGLGIALVRSVIEKAPENLFLATIIPRYFEKLGFKKASSPKSIRLRRKDPIWCEGCYPEKCVVMKYEYS